MKKRLKRLCSLVLALVIISGTVTEAAGKKAVGLENNTPTGTSDAKVFVNGIKGYDSAYTTTYKGPSSVTNNDFFKKDYCIKYWSSHGAKDGTVWGASNNVSVNIFNQNFSWAGDKLEFAFLAACHQLDGAGSNPRARYAKAMVGDKAVRVICGYHEQAPASIDKDVADKFIDYAKTGESVKSSWILANKYWNDKGYSTDDYCVLTHSGNVQYSRFPGFPGATYTRPGSSSTSILRFTKANPNGTSQPKGSARNYKAASYCVPNYALKAVPIELDVENTEDMAVLREDGDVMLIGDEIGNKPLSQSSEDALESCKKAFDDVLVNFSDIDIDNADISVTPIVMAEVNFDGGEEIENTVAYDVTIKNTYDGVEILGDYLSGIVDDKSVSYLAGSWNEFEKVESDSYQSGMNYVDAYSKLKKGMTNGFVPKNTLSSVKNRKIVFSYNEKTGYYEPNWMFEAKGKSTKYVVNCFNGKVKTMK